MSGGGRGTRQQHGGAIVGWGYRMWSDPPNQPAGASWVMQIECVVRGGGPRWWWMCEGGRRGRRSYDLG